MQGEINSLLAFFSSLNVPVSNNWVEDCVQWCKEEILGPNYSLDELKGNVHEHWLSFDLREIEAPILPLNLSEHKKFILKDSYSLQIMQVLDISKPKHWQLQQIRKENILTRANKQEDGTFISSKRMLQLLLTDGVQFVEAMEYTPIPCLNINISPGSKIRLIGPITIRRGRLMLEDKNVQLLGGKVEEILISHAVENVLARALGLPENPHPQMIEETLFDITQEDTESSRGPATARNFQNVPIRRQVPDSIAMGAKSTPENPKNFNISDKDEERYAAEIELLLEAENDLNASTSNPSKRMASHTPDLFEDDFNDVDFDIIEMREGHKAEKKGNMIGLSNNRNMSNPSNMSATSSIKPIDASVDLFPDDDIFEKIDIDCDLNHQNSTALLEESNILSIIDLKDKSGVNGIFKIRARFKTVIERLVIREGQFRLVIKVEDDTGEITCQVHTDVVTGFAGVHPTAMETLKENKSFTEIMLALESVKNRLNALDDVIEVKINEKGDIPIIVRVL